MADKLMYIVHLPLPRKGGILLRFLSDQLENPEHHPRVMGWDTLTPKDIKFSNIHKTTNPLIVQPLSEKSANCAW